VENTPMQAVIDRYKTDKVKPIPHRTEAEDFIVQDTNSAIWYVETQRSNGYNTNGNYEYFCIRNTLLFEGIKKVDKIKLEE
jgi:hypothetical protein